MFQTSRRILGQCIKRVCCVRVAPTPLQLRGTRSAVSHSRPTRHAHACKRSPSVRLLRRFQFCKSGPISLRSLDRLTFAKRGTCSADIFTQGSNRPNRPYRPPQPSGLADLTFCNTADSASASRGDTADLVLEDVVITALTAASRPRGLRPRELGFVGHSGGQLRDREATDLLNLDLMGAQEGASLSVAL